jgi:hypothetical protein
MHALRVITMGTMHTMTMRVLIDIVIIVPSCSL